MIPESWNPAVSVLLASCWAQDASLRPSLVHIRSALSLIMSRGQALITISSSNGAAVADGHQAAVGELGLAPGALWRRIQVDPAKISLGDVLGSGASSRVHKCLFQNKQAVCKIFRNSTEEKAFKEIEMTFALRHPNVIGLYAWFQIRGECGSWQERILQEADTLFFCFWSHSFCVCPFSSHPLQRSSNADRHGCRARWRRRSHGPL